MSAVRYQREPLVEAADPGAASPGGTPSGSPRPRRSPPAPVDSSELAQVVGHDAERSADADPGVGQRRLERPDHVAGRPPPIRRAPGRCGPATAGVRRCARPPIRSRPASATTSTSSPHRAAGSPVTSATTNWMVRRPAASPERRDRTGHVLGPSLHHPVQAHVGGRRARPAPRRRRPARTRVGRRAGAASSRQPPGSSTTVQPAAAISPRRASAAAKSCASRAVGAPLREGPDLLGRVGHRRRRARPSRPSWRSAGARPSPGGSSRRSRDAPAADRGRPTR